MAGGAQGGDVDGRMHPQIKARMTIFGPAVVNGSAQLLHGGVYGDVHRREGRFALNRFDAIIKVFERACRAAKGNDVMRGREGVCQSRAKPARRACDESCFHGGDLGVCRVIGNVLSQGTRGVLCCCLQSP
jgi:hypothetical protein